MKYNVSYISVFFNLWCTVRCAAEKKMISLYFILNIYIYIIKTHSSVSLLLAVTPPPHLLSKAL